jgi:hypothetical protein
MREWLSSVTRMVTEYEALGTLIAQSFSRSPGELVESRTVARHGPVAHFHCKTVEMADQIRSLCHPSTTRHTIVEPHPRIPFGADHQFDVRGRGVLAERYREVEQATKGDLMGFMDKVKEGAASAASAAKDAAAKGQAKVGEVQAKRGADGVLRQLGLAAYLQTQNRAPATTESDIEKYIETLKAYEAEHGELTAEDSPS